MTVKEKVVPNEVYGEVRLDVSVPVTGENEGLGVLQANYDYHNDRFVECEVVFKDDKGNAFSMKVHNWDILLDTYFN